MDEKDIEREDEDERESSSETRVFDPPAINAPNDAKAQMKMRASDIQEAYQIQEIEAVAASLPQYDVSEGLTQNILRAVEAEPAYGKNRDSIMTASTIFAVILAGLFVIETQESVGGILSWMVGLAVMYSISLLVSSSHEAETV